MSTESPIFAFNLPVAFYQQFRSRFMVWILVFLIIGLATLLSSTLQITQVSESSFLLIKALKFEKYALVLIQERNLLPNPLKKFNLPWEFLELLIQNAFQVDDQCQVLKLRVLVVSVAVEGVFQQVSKLLMQLIMALIMFFIRFINSAKLLFTVILLPLHFFHLEDLKTIRCNQPMLQINSN